MFKPHGKYERAYLAGKRDRQNNVPYKKNPMRFGADYNLSAWWQKGWNEENDKLTND